MIDRKAICQKLERQKCKVHNQHPKARVAGKSIQIEACCSQFRQQLEQMVDKEVNKQIDDSLDNLFK